MSLLSILHPPTLTNVSDNPHWQTGSHAALSLILAQVLRSHTQPILILAPDHGMAARLHEEMQTYLPANSPLFSFADWETLPYDHFSPHQDIISDRLSTLSRLPHLTEGAVITTVSTLMQPLPPASFLDAYAFDLKKGDKLNLDTLRARLSNAGYFHVSQVREHGEFAVRGSIVDIFPMGSTEPLRIDLFDDDIDSLRLFSTETQRSGELIDAIRLLPAKEYPIDEKAIEHFRQSWRNAFGGNPTRCPLYQDISEGIFSSGIEYYLPLFFEKTETLFDYLPPNTTIIFIDDIEQKIQEFWAEVNFRYEQGKNDSTRPLLPPATLFTPPEALQAHFKPFHRLYLNHPKRKPNLQFNASDAPMAAIEHRSHEPLGSLAKLVLSFPGRILFSAETLGRREALLTLFRQIHLSPTQYHTFDEYLKSDERIGMIIAPLDAGFQLTEPALLVLTENELTGRRVMQRRLRKKSTQDPDAIIRDLTELQINDPVVHFDHGVGRYRGLQVLTVGDQIAEFLMLEYQGGDKLYVPVGSLHLISRYTGADAEHTPLHKLGHEQWARAKRRAAMKVRDVAAELLDLYAKRAARPGEKYTLQEEQYAAFCTGFPFEETPDQLNAIQNVFNDLTSDKPMDRVICGDVGFGKTEVAMRAAFMAVTNHKQVIVLVPTTLLAQQHFRLFQDRFADWPIRVECLSRFRTAKEQTGVLAALKDGKADIVIGTHKLLQNGLEIKNLGLIIVDEEHRFGVRQKEKLKTLRTNVDLLTLTATPIPRTLNMSLAGIRDLSIIATPPLKRLSVKTFVHEEQGSLVQEAIQREIMRGGQVYFLHNDVASIDKKAAELEKMVQEARVVVAHGQLHERDLERIMSDFYHRRFNVLVCSTIVESGIDIPTANTIIINRADKFGIAQLHQLRGRVGRSHHQAYAYLLTPPKNMMTADAIKRLDAIAAFDDLGIGFTLATHDLEIRGAGELLGENQSGDMQEVGFSIYMDLLSRAVDALKHGKTPELDTTLMQQRTELDCHLSALIPDDYLGDIHLRLQCYKRIASAKTNDDLYALQVEMVDRFGLFPDPLKHLFTLSELKLKADALGIKKMDVNAHGCKIEFNATPSVKPETIIRLLQQKSSPYRMDGPTRLKVMLPPHQPVERLTFTQTILDELSDANSHH
jgi:transcription-repair coupling factor (superfamily II helicase)